MCLSSHLQYLFINYLINIAILMTTVKDFDNLITVTVKIARRYIFTAIKNFLHFL